MPRSSASRARRTLTWLVVLIIASVGGLAAAVQFSNAGWTPRLALDLAGGTEIVLEPVVEPGQGEITEETITEAINIIRQRIDSSGVAEAEISTAGGNNIIVSLPGDPAEQADAIALVQQSAAMQFRPVITYDAGTAPAATADPSASDPAAGVDPSAPVDPAATADPSASADPGAVDPSAAATTESTAGSVLPSALMAETSPTTDPAAAATDPAAAATDPAATDPAAAATDPAAADPAAATPTAAPTDPSDVNWVTPELAAQFSALDCSDPSAVGTSLVDDPSQAVVTCGATDGFKYILGPVEVQGADITSAAATLGTTSTGAATNEWGVDLEFDGAGSDAFTATTTRISALEQPRNQFAIVLDGVVISAPSVSGPITGGQARISGSFDQESATTLANQLQFGALPISFDVQTQQAISATLGSEQLQRGILAGAIGLVLVAIYSLFQYRLLGLVTIASLVLAAGLNLLAIDLLSWYQGYRLSLAGVAGLIVSIGITADSFIVFFERVRDEVREGRPLVPAVEVGWQRARRTILISDAVNFLAAAVLYVLAVGSVRGFAFTLGLTTLIDLLVVVMFTHPLVVLLARTNFFGQGHRFSGFDAKHLGRSVAYAGRGRVRGPEAAVPRKGRKASAASEVDAEAPMTIAERKAAAARGADATTGNGTTSTTGRETPGDTQVEER